MADSSALVTLAVDDSIDTIIDKVRKAGASHVEVLVPQGTQALHSRKSCDKLREISQRNDISLMVFTSDEKVLRSAQTCQIDTVAVDAELMMPASPVAAPVTAAPVARSTSVDDDFLASLEDVPAAPAPPASSARGLETPQVEREKFTAQEDDWAAALDSFSVAAIGGEDALREHHKSTGVSDDDAWADAFNDLSDAFGGDESAAPPRQRVRAEDIMLTADDLDRQKPKGKQKGKGKGKGKDQRSRGKSAPSMFAADEDSSLEQEVSARHRRRRMVIVGGLAVVVLLGLAGWWYLNRSAKVTIRVQPPAPQAGVKTYDLRINYSETPITDTTSLAIQGRMIEVPVIVTIPGRVLSATEQPDQAAAGVVQVYNRNPQPYTLPANTRFTTTNPAGEQVSYFSTSEIVIPAASVSLAGSTNGVADVPITAVSGGPRYNLAPNSEGNWQIEGFEGALLGINAQPVGGGTNSLLKTPTEADISPLLSQAIPMFANMVPQAMQSQLQPNEKLGGGGFSPDIAALAENPDLYSAEPRPIPNTDGEFELVVTANFRGLAVADNFPQQFDRAVHNALRMNGVDPATVRVDSTWRVDDNLNANLLLVSAKVAPQSTAQLPQTVQDEIRQAIAGKSRAQALAKLKELEQQGKIGAKMDIPADLAQLPAAEDIVIKVAP